MEQGLDTLVGPRGVRLSGGQIQRAAAARMFVRDAELLVFDDLSSALDVETERLLWERLFAASRDAPPAWSSRTAAPPCAAPTRSSCSRTAASRPTARLDELLATSPEMHRLWHGEAEADTPAELDYLREAVPA